MNPQQLALQKMQQPTPAGVVSAPIPITPDDQQAQSTPDPASPYQIDEARNKAMGAALGQQTATQSAVPTQQSNKGSLDYKQLKSKGYSSTQIESYLTSNPGVTLKNAPDNWDADIKQNTIIPKAAPITEHYGDIQPGVEVFSGGFTSGTGIGVKKGTPLATPPGKWQVVDSFDQAPQKGYIGNSSGQGWGNNVLLKNTQTGEMLRYSHLSEVGVTKGDTINGSRVIGLSGQSGNTTGDHLNLEYLTPDGKPADVLQSQYAKYLPISEK